MSEEKLIVTRSPRARRVTKSQCLDAKAQLQDLRFGLPSSQKWRCLSKDPEAISSFEGEQKSVLRAVGDRQIVVGDKGTTDHTNNTGQQQRTFVGAALASELQIHFCARHSNDKLDKLHVAPSSLSPLRFMDMGAPRKEVHRRAAFSTRAFAFGGIELDRYCIPNATGL